MARLPIHYILSEIKSALNEHNEVILNAAPGAGKTTVVPLSLLNEAWLNSQKILLLEPRRVAARSAAERMSQTLNEAVGTTVGYRMRQESCVSKHTRIEVVTEGVFNRLLQNDPSLEGYGVVIFDEFHERSLEADLGLALSLEARSIFREEQALKLLIMSATLDNQPLEAILPNAPIISSEGRSFPVDIIYSRAISLDEWIVPVMVQAIQRALSEYTGDILCFLPGQKEIRHVQTRLQESLSEPHLSVLPLHGGLSLAEQRKAIAPSGEDKQKIILATNIAEASLTIDGVSVVIDSGLMRESRYDAATGMSRLHTCRISKASSIQRAGRAGRTAAGTCIRLWSKDQQQQLVAFNTPDIAQADLSHLTLQLVQWGIKHPNEITWLTPPSDSAFQSACRLLKQLNAIDDQLNLTPQGEHMMLLPAHPRIAHMLVKSIPLGWIEQACLLAATLLEKDPSKQPSIHLLNRIEWVKHNALQATAKRITKQAAQYQAICKKIAERINPTASETIYIPEDKRFGVLAAFAYPDRVARRTKASTYKMASGRAVQFHQTDTLESEPWLVITDINANNLQRTDTISSAVSLDETLFKTHFADQFTHTEVIHWDETTDHIIAEQQQRLFDLVISTSPINQPSNEAVESAILALIQRKGLAYLDWPSELELWRQRVQFAANAQPSYDWPNLSDEALLVNISTWLTPYLSGITSLKQLKALNYKTILHSLLPWPLPKTLDEVAPTHYLAPSGSRVAIDYSQQPPVLAIKLQEMFGCQNTPTIGGIDGGKGSGQHGHIALQIHLLSPARRPLHVTQDLSSFWQHGYQDVKKEMKGRYPKHPWPDDPISAVPTAKTKKAMS